MVLTGGITDTVLHGTWPSGKEDLETITNVLYGKAVQGVWET